MQVKKKVVGISLITLIVALFLGGLVWIMREAQIAWDDNNTWKVDSSVALPVVAEGVFKMKQEQVDDSTTRIIIPFCVLHKTVQKENDVTEYHCAAIPYSTLELVDFFPTSFHLKDDIVFTFNPEQDVLPDEFLGKIGINPVTLKSFGAEPVPITAEFEVTHEKPRKTPTAFFTHYRKTLAGETETYAQTSLTSWSVNNVRLAADYSEEERKQIITEWRKQAWEDVNKIFKTESFLNAANAKDLVQGIAENMPYRNVHCPTAQNNSECQLGYKENISTNLIFYTYTAEELDPQIYEKVVDAVNTRLTPFVRKYNRELYDFYTDCSPEECPYYFRLEAYNYPACPILEFGKTGSSKIKSFFLDFRDIASVEGYSVRTMTKAEILEVIQNFKKEYIESKTLREYSKESIREIDDLCFKVLNENITDKDIIDGMEELFMLNVLGQLYISEDKYLNNINYEDAIFQIVLDASLLNPYDHSFVPQTALGYQRFLTGIQETEVLPDDEYWASLYTTVMVLYLTSQY
ncbi:MAG: hypothetical protein QY312_01145 [Candidatus Dojkabacteria bacterium]|nr:MAG: hypothetical protein QY312_01145 [Candidatus Dojkabacteria bacterium]